MHMDLPELKPIIQVEVRLVPQCSIPYSIIRDKVQHFIIDTKASLVCFQEVLDFKEIEDDPIWTFVDRIWIGECSGSRSVSRTPSLGEAFGNAPGHNHTHLEYSPTSAIDLDCGKDGYTQGARDIFATKDVDLSIHVYQLHDQGAIEEYSEPNGDLQESVMMAHHWTLPCHELEGIWDNLIYDDHIQTMLLEYVYTTILFSDKGVNPDLISWNRVVLLYGPPGTGKTSLCRSLAQKLSVRLAGRYRYGKLLEINSHSLFSKWFSESGKMVQRMFDQIWSMVEDEDAFVCVLIDEVESLAAARKAALSGNEPSDSIRVVNALLTQLDRLKQRKNVLILTTSNITEAIDIAFIDRADIKVHIGLPSQKAIYNILHSSLLELQRANIIQPKVELMDWRLYQYKTNDQEPSGELARAHKLHSIAGLAAGMSGRTIRKIPFLAHAAYIQFPSATMDVCLAALHRTVLDEQKTRKTLANTGP